MECLGREQGRSITEPYAAGLSADSCKKLDEFITFLARQLFFGGAPHFAIGLKGPGNYRKTNWRKRLRVERTGDIQVPPADFEDHQVVSNG